MHAMSDIVNINGCKHVLLALIKSSKCSNLFVLFLITKASVVYKMEIKSYI